MFERFQDRTRRAVVLAQEEARMLSHNYIGTEHLLLGLLHEGEGIAAKTLESLGISLDGARIEVERIIGRGMQTPSGAIPFTPRCKKTLELSLDKALELENNYIYTEHLLLALVGADEGATAIRVLHALSVKPEHIGRACLLRVTAKPSSPPEDDVSVALRKQLEGRLDELQETLLVAKKTVEDLTVERDAIVGRLAVLPLPKQ